MRSNSFSDMKHVLLSPFYRRENSKASWLRDCVWPRTDSSPLDLGLTVPHLASLGLVGIILKTVWREAPSFHLQLEYFILKSQRGSHKH